MRLSDKVMTDSTNARKSTDNIMDECCVGTAKLNINGHTDRDSGQRIDRAVLKVTGLRRSVSTVRVRQFFVNYAPVRYVGRRPDGHYLVRFSNERDADNVLTKIDGSTQVADNGSAVHCLTLSGQEVSAQVLTGEEEDSFWTTTAQCSKRKAYRLQRRRGRRKKVGNCVTKKRTDSQLETGTTVPMKRLAQQIA